MKKVKVICPKCNNTMTYKNWFSWILHTPFHWFGKRRTKCTNCGKISYIGREHNDMIYQEMFSCKYYKKIDTGTLHSEGMSLWQPVIKILWFYIEDKRKRRFWLEDWSFRKVK